MSTSDERRDIAETLRYVADYPGREIRYMEQFIAELRETIFCDVCSDADYIDILQRLADLIDPTCEMKPQGDGFRCSACGTYHDMGGSEEFPWSRCPECGARVVSR